MSWINFFREDYNGQVSPVSVYFDCDKQADDYMVDLSKIDSVFGVSHTKEPKHNRQIEHETGRIIKLDANP